MSSEWVCVVATDLGRTVHHVRSKFPDIQAFVASIKTLLSEGRAIHWETPEGDTILIRSEVVREIIVCTHERMVQIRAQAREAALAQQQHQQGQVIVPGLVPPGDILRRQ